MSMQNKKSPVWLHFTLISESKAKCDVCGNILSYKGSAISNLKKHLKVKHPIVCKNELQQETKKKN